MGRVPNLAVDDLSSTRVMSRDENMENIAAPGVPKVGDGGKAPVKPVKVEARQCSCGQVVAEGWAFCPKCGTALISKCAKCGAENQTGQFCSSCGKKLKRGRSK